MSNEKSSRVSRARTAVDQATSRVVGGTLDAAVSTGRKVQRLGWKAEKKLAQGAQVMRRHPGKTMAVVFGVAALASLLVLSRRKSRD